MWHGSARPLHGETMRDLQQRVVEHLEAIRSEPIASAIMVSHAEPIRAFGCNRSDRFKSVAICICLNHDH